MCKHDSAFDKTDAENMDRMIRMALLQEEKCSEWIKDCCQDSLTQQNIDTGKRAWNKAVKEIQKIDPKF